MSNNATGTFYGIYLNNSNGCSINNCSIAKNQAVHVLYGVYGLSGEKSAVNSCQVNNNTATNNNAHGIYISNNCTLYLIQNCDANYNTSSSANGIGIYIDDNANYCIIKNCNCFYNKSVGIFNDNSTTFITGCAVGGNPTNYGGTFTPTPINIPILGENNKTSIINQFANVEFVLA